MSDCFSDRAGPESYDRNAASVASFNHLSHNVRLREAAGKLDHIIFSPVITRPVKRPHVVRWCILHL